MRIVFLKITSLAIFMGLLFIGFSLARQKPLWVDEVYSQKSLQELSYVQIFSGQMPEGNNSPLFYSIQKVISDLAGYRLPSADYEIQIWDERTMLLLRLSPIAALALAMTFIFYFFARYYGVWTGCYGLLTAFFTYNVWLYWAEARPYALLFFLTAMQSLIFVNILRQREIDRGSWRWLVFVHFLLALTSIFSVLEICAVSLLLWIIKERDWKKYILLTVIPVAICIPYYFFAVKAKFFFPATATQLIYPCFPLEWIGLLIGYALFLVFRSLQAAGERSGENDPIPAVALGYLAFTVLMFLAAAFVLTIFKINSIPRAEGGFEISHRYFIYLTPVGIIAVTWAAVHLAGACRGHPWRWITVMIAVWGFLFINILRNCIWAIWFF